MTARVTSGARSVVDSTAQSWSASTCTAAAGSRSPVIVASIVHSGAWPLVGVEHGGAEHVVDRLELAFRSVGVLAVGARTVPAHRFGQSAAYPSAVRVAGWLVSQSGQ